MPPEVASETNSLRQALDAANRQIAETNRRLADVEGRSRIQENVGRFANQLQAVDTAIANAESAEAVAKQKWTTLQQEGNFEAAADALQQMTRAAGELSTLRSQRQYLADQAQQAERQPPQQADPLAQYSQQEREWINKNPRYLNDPEFQKNVQAAALYAERYEGASRNSPEWFEAIERRVYPERFQEEPQPEPEPRQVQRQQRETGGEVDDGNGDQVNIEERPAAATVEVRGEQQQMQNGEPRAEEPQARAVGRGGSIRQTAAPPSRRIADAAAPMRNRQISLSPEEFDAAQQLAMSIEPDVAAKGPQEIANWYYMMAHHPSHQRTRRKSWARDAVTA